MRRRRPKGALVLELLVGFGLITVALLSLFSLFPAGERAAALADKSAQALSIADSVLQEQMAKSHPTLVEGSSVGVVTLSHTLRRGVEMTTNFHYDVQTSLPDPDSEIFRIVVSVRWEEGSESNPRDGRVQLLGEKGPHL